VPQLVADINPQGASSGPTELTQVGNVVFFAADDGVHGVELWKSDGTAAGTTMVKDIRAGAKGSGPTWLTAVGNELFFVANDGKHRTQVWKSDGTAAGTVRVSDITNYDYVGPYGLDVEVPMVAVGSQLFFFNTYCCVGGANLYVSDGTAAGTRRVNDEDTILSTPDTETAAAFNGKLYFDNYGSDSDLFGSVLWVSDGTKGGTHVLDGSPAADEIAILPAAGQNLYFAANSELWKTDGTAAGTQLLTSLGEVPRHAAYMAKRLYFDSSTWNEAENRYDVQLWKSDGTASGTQPYLIFRNGISLMTPSSNRLFFLVGSHLWSTDGSPAGSHDLGTFGAGGLGRLVDVGGTLCFTDTDWDGHAWSLWESHGNAATTRQVGSFINPPDEFQRAVASGRLFFAADDGVHGTELWSYTP
jgi:ELWxxDGT repeat protein